jgi:hypothetical protein
VVPLANEPPQPSTVARPDKDAPMEVLKTVNECMRLLHLSRRAALSSEGPVMSGNVAERKGYLRYLRKVLSFAIIQSENSTGLIGERYMDE